jgi:hypothetical protein
MLSGVEVVRRPTERNGADEAISPDAVGGQ